VKQSAERRTAGVSEAKGQNMSDAQLNDVGHENALTRDELLAASAITQFYAFASRCMEWANTTRSLQERGVYVQMGLQWLAAGARLQTFLRLKNSQVARSASDREGTTHQALSPDGEHGAHHRQLGGLHVTTDE
jgi:hypothetical protein